VPFADSQGCRIYYRLEGAANRPLLVLVHALDWRGCGSERRVRRVTTAAAAYVLGYAAS
jgi:hypothetical protein